MSKLRVSIISLIIKLKIEPSTYRWLATKRHWAPDIPRRSTAAKHLGLQRRERHAVQGRIWAELDRMGE